MLIIAKAGTLAKLVNKVKNHLVDNKKFYLSLGYTVAISILLDPTAAFAGIEDGGARIHAKLVSVGKWVIIIKGSVDTISCILNGDFETAKKAFFSYLLCFAVLLALPWSLNEVEGVFK